MKMYQGLTKEQHEAVQAERLAFRVVWHKDDIGEGVANWPATEAIALKYRDSLRSHGYDAEVEPVAEAA